MKTTAQDATCPVCSKPRRGRGKCKTSSHEAIGPRRVGDIIERRSIGEYEMVVDIKETVADWRGWSITVVDIEGPDVGRVRTHCTPWDGKNQAIVWNIAR
jgi:hypothetical protein